MIPAPLKHFDVVVVPFPYSDKMGKTKRRPAVIISKSASYHKKTHKIIVAMITTSSTPWPHDVKIMDDKNAGLHLSCVIRMKIFTLEQTHILEHIGSLSARDRKSLIAALKQTLVA
jgi:mRNA interferase MazF